MQGWIKLHRQILDNEIFQENRVYSKAEAWIDLLLLANHKDDKVLINSNLIEVMRGQHLTSIKKLGERWKWSRTKVKHFLDLLVKDEMLSYKSTTKYTLVTLVNYNFYQGREHEKEQQKNIKKTSEKHQKSTNKNDLRMNKNGEELNHPPTLIRGGKYIEHAKNTRSSTNLEFFK
jgi:DNA replication protein DnaD